MTWTLDDHLASASVTGWTIRSNLGDPGRGWSILRGDSEAAKVGLLAIKSSVPMSPLEEAYIRQSDLVTRYPQTSEPGIDLEFRYRIVSASDTRIALQITCAIQTRQFEAYPTLGLSIPKVSANQIGIINTWDDEQYPGAIVMEQADVAQSRLTADGDGDSVELFGDFLERGVIRKCRMRLIVGSSDCSDLQCDDELKALMQEPLPLLT